MGRVQAIGRRAVKTLARVGCFSVPSRVILSYMPRVTEHGAVADAMASLIRGHRHMAGYSSMDKAADALPEWISRKTYERIEKGEIPVDVAQLAEIGELFGFDPATLLSDAVARAHGEFTYLNPRGRDTSQTQPIVTVEHVDLGEESEQPHQ
jgi:hypothetical protein